jgi:hypothetical protein
MGILRTTPAEFAEGKICFSLAAAAVAFCTSLPQSSNSNRHCRTGFEKLIFPLSMKVMFLTPHDSRFL